MFTRFYGHYLLNKGILDAAQLNAVLDKMKETRLRLGVIAIHEGYLTPEQVQSIHDQQQRTDKRFGEIAIELGLLTDTQVQHLLSNQGSEYLQLVQALVDGGVMTLDQIQQSMHEYKVQNALNDSDFESLKYGDVVPLFRRLLNGVPQNVQDYATLFYKNMVRFVTPDVHLAEIALKSEHSEAAHLFSQSLIAADQEKRITAFTADQGTLVQFAEKYAKEPMSGMDDYTIDVCKEFLNLHNGLFTVNMSDLGHKFDLDIQTHQQEALLPTDCHILTFGSSIGPVHLHVNSRL